MKYEFLKRERALALDPTRGGFGFVVLEDEPLQLLDWGVAMCRRHGSCLDAVERLITSYKPTVLVIEDWTAAGSLRRPVLEDFVARVAGIFVNGVAIRSYSRLLIRDAFAPVGALTKYQIAQVLAARFPEIAPRLPKPRQVWEAEDPRMSIFDAASLALAHFGVGDYSRS